MNTDIHKCYSKVKFPVIISSLRNEFKVMNSSCRMKYRIPKEKNRLIKELLENALFKKVTCKTSWSTFYMSSLR